MSKLSAGTVFASLILTGALVMFRAPPEVGIVIMAGAFIWGLLALPSWGFLRRWWDSKPARNLSVENWGEHKFGSPEKNGFAKATACESLMLRIYVGLHAIPNMFVDSVQLEIKRKRLPSSWEPDEISVGVSHACYVYFGIPRWVKAGKHKVKLVAFADGKDWFSRDFTVEFPKQN